MVDSLLLWARGFTHGGFEVTRGLGCRWISRFMVIRDFL